MAVPIVTVDGPGGSGKGAVGQRLAARLRWHYLDSGAIYRALGVAAAAEGIAPTDEVGLAALAQRLPVHFSDDGRIFLGNHDLSHAIRAETAGALASQISGFPAVRAALLQKQRDYCQPPGLVADGRDMGTVVFPHATAKFFLTASAEIRAERRFKQLKEKGFDANLPRLFGEICERDARDAARAASPLKPAADALVLDTSTLNIDEVVEHILGHLPAALIPRRG